MSAASFDAMDHRKYIERIVNEMTIQFSLESVEYLAEKVHQCYSIPDEALAYLTTRITEIISDLLQVKTRDH